MASFVSSQITSCLTWTDTSDPERPIAFYQALTFLNPPLGSALWLFRLGGVYHGRRIHPISVAIDNSGNGNYCLIDLPGEEVLIPGYQRITIQLPKECPEISINMVGTPAALTAVTFYTDRVSHDITVRFQP